MNRWVPNSLILAATLVVAPSWVQGGSLRKIWEFRLAPIIKESAPSDSADSDTVNAIKFSPNEQHLAVVAGMHPIEGSFRSHLLIFETKTPGAVNQQFELGQGVLPGDEYPAQSAVFWSPEGDTVAVFGAIVALRDGTICSPDGWEASVGGYLDSQTLVGRVTPTHVDREHPSSHFLLFSPQCEIRDTWNVDDAWVIGDVSPKRGLALVQKAYLYHVGLFNPPRGTTFLVDFHRKQVIRRWPADELLPKQVRFAESGKTLCAAGGGVRRDVSPVRCLDVDTGNVIAEAATVKRAWSIVTASESSRVVIAQYRPEPDNKPTTPLLDRRIVWDFRTNQRIALWRPEFQKWRYPIGNMRDWRSNPFVFAISPTGKYIAEGGNGVLRLYEIEP